jgi:hypothetical protein
MSFDNVYAGTTSFLGSNNTSFVAIQLQKGITYTGMSTLCNLTSSVSTTLTYGLYNSTGGTTSSTLLASSDALVLASIQIGTLVSTTFTTPYLCTATGIFYTAVRIGGTNYNYASTQGGANTTAANLGVFTSVSGVLTKRSIRIAGQTSTTLPNSTSGLTPFTNQVNIPWIGLY